MSRLVVAVDEATGAPAFFPENSLCSTSPSVLNISGFTQEEEKKMNYCQISYPSCSAAGAVHGVNARVICLPRIAVPCPHPPPSLLLSFCFVLAGNSAGSFQHILSLSHWKAVSNGGIMVLNVFPFRTRLQNHTQPVGKKKVLVRKVGQEQRLTPPHRCIRPHFSIRCPTTFN